MNPNDDERDAWLAQALRHAPDANTDAPPALSNAILREARAMALRPAPPAAPPRPNRTGPLQWLGSAWGWLARPPVAAGFASLMVATLVGVMWWEQPLDESLPRAPELVSPTPQARAEAAPPAVVAAAPAAPAAQKPGNASRSPAAQGRLADTKESEKSARASRAIDEQNRLRGADAAPAATPPPQAFPVAKAMAESSAQAAADQATPPRNDLRAMQGGASPALAKARAADVGDAPLATLLAQIKQQPERWRWQRDPGSAQPMNAAVQRWLVELDRQTASRWQAGTGNTAGEPAGSLRLLRDGALQATLGFTGSAVWIEASGASLVQLPENSAESLRKALDQATP